MAETTGEPVTVAVCHGDMEAAVVQSRLQACGIESWRAGGFSAYPTYMDGLGEIRIEVAAVDAERATEVLNSSGEGECE